MSENTPSKASAATILNAERSVILGEGPRIYADSIYWLDIMSGRLHVLNLKSRQRKTHEFDEEIGSISLCRSGRFLVALRSGMYFFDLKTEKLDFLCHPEAKRPGIRYNDGRSGPDGRFYVGSMYSSPRSRERHPKGGNLWVVSADGSFQKLETGFEIPNGLAWDDVTASSATFYHVETMSHEVRAYELELNTAKISNRRVAMRIPDELGYPDGVTLSANGTLLISMFFGSCVLACDPKLNKILYKIEVPTPQVTAIALSDTAAYITSAAEHYSAEDYAKNPNAGNLFAVDTAPLGLSPGVEYLFAD